MVSTNTLSYVIIFDNYQQPWKVEQDNPLYAEAKAATDAAGTEPVVWPIAKLVEGRGWGWWVVFKNLDQFELDLEQLVPNPGKQRLVDITREYTPTELSDILQAFGSYLATIHHMEGMIEAQCHALKEGLRTGLAVAATELESRTTTQSGREAEILASNDLFRHTRKMQIDHEATLLLLKGWRESYETAWSTISRIISLRIGEVSLSTGRHP